MTKRVLLDELEDFEVIPYYEIDSGYEPSETYPCVVLIPVDTDNFPKYRDFVNANKSVYAVALGEEDIPAIEDAFYDWMENKNNPKPVDTLIYEF